MTRSNNANPTLLNRHSVITTVRSQGKADQIKAVFSKYDESQLDFAIVEDIAQPSAFKDAVVSTPPFEAVIHTASPFTFNVKDIQKVRNTSRVSRSQSNTYTGPP